MRAVIGADKVIEFLRMHPAFLVEHPELLKMLCLRDQQHGNVTDSLLQRQNQLLRNQIEEQEQNLQALSRAALSNEHLLNRWHGLTLELLATTDTLQFFDLLDARLRRDFDADYVVLRLVDAKFESSDLLKAAMVQRATTEFQTELQQLLSTSSAYCGRLTVGKREAVFGQDQPASVTLVAVAGAAILAIGSDDADRFSPGMGGLFIELLGKTVAWQLQRYVEEYRKQA